MCRFNNLGQRFVNSYIDIHAAATRVTGMKRHILVVDDEIGALTLIGIMLERGGFGVSKASDARAALELLDSVTPDLIILDVMMPGMNGIELCRAIRRRETTLQTPVLILSARGDSESVIQGIEAGANDYLPKPILHHDLVSKIKSMLGQNISEV
jgi:DNA-binding response OmpR family regulator